ncbi:hypothetical protein E2C01_064385 [Portunus trituberculatus]|uniref:Uncharacterized protein n=1 Tax=Portunus trituberculatus TaxID=210409 RepID=A0A5B7HJL7_PORTR|nr:hypothetical protein [Portunus trituberculatus]
MPQPAEGPPAGPAQRHHTNHTSTLISATTSVTALNSTVSGKLQQMEGLCEGLQQHHASVSADVNARKEGRESKEKKMNGSNG